MKIKKRDMQNFGFPRRLLSPCSAVAICRRFRTTCCLQQHALIRGVTA